MIDWASKFLANIGQTLFAKFSRDQWVDGEGGGGRGEGGEG